MSDEMTETVTEETTTVATDTAEAVTEEAATEAPEAAEAVTEEAATEAPEVVEEPVVPEVTLEDAMASLSSVGAEFEGFIAKFEESSHGDYLASDAAINSTHAKNLQVNDQRVADAEATLKNSLEMLASKRANITANYEKVREDTKAYHTQMTHEQIELFRDDLKEWAKNSKADFDSLMTSWTAEEVTTDVTGDSVESTDGDA